MKHIIKTAYMFYINIWRTSENITRIFRKRRHNTNSELSCKNLNEDKDYSEVTVNRFKATLT